MINLKIINEKNSQKEINENKIRAFWIKSFNKGSNYFLDKEMKGSYLLLDKNDQAFETEEEGFYVSDKIGNILVSGFIEDPDFMKVLYYYGNDNVQDIYHNSKSEPNLIIIKKIDGNGDWLLWNNSFGGKHFLYLNSDKPLFENPSIFLMKPPNQYYFRISDSYNEKNKKYIAVLFFKSKGFNSGIYEGGVEKVYTGIKNDLVIIKNLYSQSNWRVFSKLFKENESFKLNRSSKLQIENNIKVRLEENYFYPENKCNSINKEKNKYLYISFSNTYNN